jgi:exosome complex component RRP4
VKNIVVPGEMIAEQAVSLENAYVDNGRTYSKILGLYEQGSRLILPLEGAWRPRIGDMIIGVVTNIKNSVYEVDLSFFIRSILIGSKYDSHTYKLGDVLEATVRDVEDRRTIILEDPRILHGGSIIKVKASKVPRIIGKNDTMIGQISEATKTHVVIGMNGVVWLKGGNVELAADAIRKVEEEAHTSGLTERIKLMLEKSLKGN